VSFKDASTLIGRSLVGDFSEIDSNESGNHEQDPHQNLKDLQKERAMNGMPLNSAIKPPYLPPLHSKSKPYTLVLDLDETLVHFVEERNTVYVRPFAVEFLQQMSNLYEVVIFTAGTKDYADWALQFLPDNAAQRYIDYRLYRDHTI
jgi:CTD small phosphatase-like protein 2